MVACDILNRNTENDQDKIFGSIKAEIRKLGETNSKIISQRAAAGWKNATNFFFDGELLFKKIYDNTEQAFTYKMVVPAGGLRSFWYNGRNYRLSLRKTLLLLYHDSEMIGGHSNREDTLAKIRATAWWPSLAADVTKWCGTCTICRLTKPQKGLTTERRTELYQRPFRTIFVDTVGPINPPDRGFTYIIHASCPFSGWCWLKPTISNSAEYVAKFLLEDVYFDIAGFPMVLRSDRGAEFLNDTVKTINDLLGVTHAFGSSYHPQSQGHIEGAHKRVSNIIAAYTSRNPRSWARWTKLAQWLIRATPQPDRGGKSPYELVTGMLPQGPLDRIMEKLTNKKSLTPDEYVNSLRQSLKTMHETIADAVGDEVEKLRRKRLEEASLKDVLPFEVGDYVFVRMPPVTLQAQAQKASGSSDQISKRLLPRAAPVLYQVHKIVSPTTVVLKDPDTGSTELNFPQPLHIDRLIKYDLQSLESAIDSGPLKLRAYDKNGTGFKGEVTSQTATGLVKIKWEGSSEPVLHDLSTMEYEWIS